MPRRPTAEYRVPPSGGSALLWAAGKLLGIGPRGLAPRGDKENPPEFQRRAVCARRIGAAQLRLVFRGEPLQQVGVRCEGGQDRPGALVGVAQVIGGLPVGHGFHPRQ